MSAALPSPTAQAGEPQYGVGPGAAVRRGFAQYVQFDGRASLSEFWWWYLFYLVATLGLISIGGLILATGGDTRGADSAAVAFFVLALVFVAAVFLPSLSLASRRLHDAGFSALYLLLGLVSGLIVLVLCAFPTSPKGDQYAGLIARGRGGYPGGPPLPGYPYAPAGPYGHTSPSDGAQVTDQSPAVYSPIPGSEALGPPAPYDPALYEQTPYDQPPGERPREQGSRPNAPPAS